MTSAERSPRKSPKEKSSKNPTQSSATTPETESTAQAGASYRRRITGVVVSDKMKKTVVVKVSRRVPHAFYSKYIVRSQRFKAHDEKNDSKLGDLVSLVESRPLSRDKRWVVTQVIRRARVGVDHPEFEG